MPKKGETLSSVKNTINVLRELSQSQKELGLTELSKRLNVSIGTINRILKTLCEEQVTIKNAETRKYRLWLTAFEIGSVVFREMEVCQISIPYLQQMEKKFSHGVVHLSVYNHGTIVYFFRTPESKDTRTFRVGKRLPPHCTAAGKVLLAHQTEEEAAWVVSESNLFAYTSQTITTVPKLREELAQIKQKGYALSYGEFKEDLYSISVPIFNDDRQSIAAISLTFSKNDAKHINQKHALEQMKMYSGLITEQLGLQTD